MYNLPPSILEYCETNSSPEPPLLHELRRYTHLHAVQPRMLCGWQQGLLLQLIAQMVSPTNVLEIGTFTGYSAICISEGLRSSGGILHTYDPDDEVLEIAAMFIGRSPHAAQIVLHNDDAKRHAPTLRTTFDLIYLDGDKREYTADYEMAVPLLRSGGILLADNVLWSGKVLERVPRSDHHTIALQCFNQHVSTDPRTQKLLLPLRDGLTIVRKI